MKESQEQGKPVQLGKDEMNFAEFPLALIGKRAPANVKTLQFVDEITDRRTGRPVKRKLTISAADVLGLPTAIDDEVMLGCVQLSFANKFATSKVPFERSEFLKLLGWKQSGYYYRRLAESLRRWKGTLIISENGFWDKGQQRWVNDSFSLLDRVYLSGRGTEEAGQDEGCYFVWGDFMWRSIEAGNLRSLDFEFIKSLDSGVSKRLYRWLGKRFYHSRTVTIDLKRLAFERIGFSRNMHTGQIKEKLAECHGELAARGFCKSQYVELGHGKWNVVYTSLAAAPTRKKEKVTSEPLIEALSARGIERASSLVEKHDASRIEAAVQNYDDRKAHGETLTPGWLHRCITNVQPYEFRRGYGNTSAAAHSRKVLKQRTDEQQKREASERRKATQVKKQFEAFLATLSASKRNAYVTAALNGQSVAAKLYRERLSACDDSQSDSIQREAMFTHWLATERQRARS